MKTKTILGNSFKRKSYHLFNRYTMTKTLYYLTITFIILTIMTGTIHVVLYMLVDYQLTSRPSFLEWFINIHVLSLITSLLLLKYFFYKRYKVIFYGALVAMILVVVQATIQYIYLNKGADIGIWLGIMNQLVIVMLLINSFILLFSKVRERQKLRMLGYATLIGGSLLLLLSVSFFIFPINQSIYPIIFKLSLWVQLILTASNVFLILNFLEEIKTLHSQNRLGIKQSIWEAVGSVMLILSIMITPMFGFGIINDSINIQNWENRDDTNARYLARDFDSDMYVDSAGDTLRYLLLKPLDYDPTKKYPLVLCLHGGVGGTDGLLHIEVSWTAIELSKSHQRRKFPAFLLVPQCPPGKSWTNLKSVPTASPLVFETIDSLETIMNIDTTRRYIIGPSHGGYGTWHFISEKPDYFAAAVPICGGGDAALAPRMINIPIWAFHGANDRSVPVTKTREMIEAIRNAGGNPRYTEYANEGHILSHRIYEKNELLSWLFDQQNQ